MRRIFIFSIFLFLSFGSFSQIGGISASKLSAYSSSTVEKHKIEFEPSFAVSYLRESWDEAGRVIHYDSITYANDFVFRFTYGITDNFETGFILPTDVNSLSWGGKYLFYKTPLLSMSIIGGVNFEFNSVHRTLHQIGSGLISTIQYTPKLSSDINLQIMRDFDDNNISLFLTADHGIYIGYVQYIIETMYWYNFENNSYEFSISPGVTIEPAQHFLMVFGYSLPILGKRTDAIRTLSFALTITLD